MSWYIDEADNLVTHDHDPDAKRYYGIDTKNTMATGDSLASGKVYVAGAEQTPVVIQGSVLAYRVTPATPTVAAGTKLGITFAWVTTLGDEDQRTVWLNVKER